jgi:hypothetical protein
LLNELKESSPAAEQLAADQKHLPAAVAGLQVPVPVSLAAVVLVPAVGAVVGRERPDNLQHEQCVQMMKLKELYG